MDPPDFRLGSHDCNNLTNPAKVSSSPNGEVDANCSLYVIRSDVEDSYLDSILKRQSSSFLSHGYGRTVSEVADVSSERSNSYSRKNSLTCSPRRTQIGWEIYGEYPNRRRHSTDSVPSTPVRTPPRHHERRTNKGERKYLASEDSPPSSCWLGACKKFFCFTSDSTRVNRVSPTNVSSKPPRPRRRSSIQALLPPQDMDDEGKPLLVLGLDGTLVHSSLEKPVDKYDMQIEFEFMQKSYTVYVKIRPHAEELLTKLKRKYEICIFTENIKVYANQVIDRLNAMTGKSIKWKLFRDSCSYVDGKYVKDLKYLGRDLAYTVIVDCKPASYMFQAENSLPCTTYRGVKSDRELLNIITCLQNVDHNLDDIRPLLRQWHQTFAPSKNKSDEDP